MKSEFDNEYSKTEYLLFKWFELLGFIEGKIRKLKEFIVRVWNSEDYFGY